MCDDGIWITSLLHELPADHPRISMRHVQRDHPRALTTMTPSSRSRRILTRAAAATGGTTVTPNDHEDTQSKHHPRATPQDVAARSSRFRVPRHVARASATAPVHVPRIRKARLPRPQSPAHVASSAPSAPRTLRSRPRQAVAPAAGGTAVRPRMSPRLRFIDSTGIRRTNAPALDAAHLSARSSAGQRRTAPGAVELDGASRD